MEKGLPEAEEKLINVDFEIVAMKGALIAEEKRSMGLEEMSEHGTESSGKREPRSRVYLTVPVRS